jgi:hypothetical protein
MIPGSSGFDTDFEDFIQDMLGKIRWVLKQMAIKSVEEYLIQYSHILKPMNSVIFHQHVINQKVVMYSVAIPNLDAQAGTFILGNHNRYGSNSLCSENALK